jgi:glycosyltransferase involved in cell wall biosynthesis
VWPSEALRVVSWIHQRVSLEKPIRKKLADYHSSVWPAAVVNRRTPSGVRWTILKDAMRIDHRALTRLVRPGLNVLRLTLARRWRSLRKASRALLSGSSATRLQTSHIDQNCESNYSKTYKISVVMPCFNHGEFLPEAVASVANAGWDDIELIVVDDGSTDEATRRVMDELAERGIKVIRQENKGLAAARNAGVRASQGEYILPLDADDRLRHRWIDAGIRILESNPEVGVVYGDAECFGTRNGRWSVGPFIPGQLLQWNYIHASALYRRSVWEQNQGYDGTMPVQGFEDWDFWLGALEHGWEFAYLPDVFFDYRQAEQSMITRTKGFESQIVAFVARKHGLLYLQAWKELEQERQSLKRVCRNLGRLLGSRLRKKFLTVRRKIGSG